MKKNNSSIYMSEEEHDLDDSDIGAIITAFEKIAKELRSLFHDILSDRPRDLSSFSTIVVIYVNCVGFIQSNVAEFLESFVPNKGILNIRNTLLMTQVVEFVKKVFEKDPEIVDKVLFALEQHGITPQKRTQPCNTQMN